MTYKPRVEYRVVYRRPGGRDKVRVYARQKDAVAFADRLMAYRDLPLERLEVQWRPVGEWQALATIAATKAAS